MSENMLGDQEFAHGREAFPSEHEFRLHCLRHSAAHIMAEAVQQLIPNAKFAIGPSIKDRFYYDMLLPHPLSTEGMEQIETRMRDIITADQEFRHEIWSKGEALSFFRDRGQTFKLELINGIPGDRVSIYRVGDFTDLCVGPHVSRWTENRSTGPGLTQTRASVGDDTGRLPTAP